ncbi:neprilysin-1-like [Leptopilina heterotoma]|uniref:neprilysin-1-like n=1 Tax=Leptopilina heterotoma TaxID=63436 RepID=UPI001CA8DD14|nr:neprilysin-1-like [Leptopilina heterotoma]
MKAVKIYFLCYLLKVVVAVPDFGNLPSFDELLRKSIIDDQDICSNVTSYACISRGRNGAISKKNYLNIAQSFIQRTALGILKLESDNTLERESTWFNACMGKGTSAENSLDTLKTTMEQTKGIQHPEDSEDLEPWENVAAFYAKTFGFSPFFEVLLYDVNSLMITRPYSMKIKSYSENALHLVVEEFLHKFTNQMFPELLKNKIKDQLNASATTFLSCLNIDSSTNEVMSFEKFSKNFDINASSLGNNFDWFGHFEDIGLKVNAHDVFYFDTDYFEELVSLLVTLSNGEIANLIHFLYAMNSRVYSTWHNEKHASTNKYTEGECFTHMPVKSRINDRILKGHHLSGKFLLLENIVKNIVREYEKEVDNSWLDDNRKELFLHPLRRLEIEITNEKTKPQDETNFDFPVEMNGLLNIINFEKAHIQFLVRALRRYHIKIPRNMKYGKSLVPYVNYNDENKHLEIPLEELILPLFDSELTIAWNYAYFGVAISRELFKLYQKLYSAIPKHSEPFNSKMNCFKVLQYSVKENVNFYDLINSCVGLKIAYKAFKHEINAIEDNPQKIFGLQYTTPKQQFFLAYSAIYCEETNPEIVGISVSNLESFARAFYCEADSPMNPSGRCDFWAKPE